MLATKKIKRKLLKTHYISQCKMGTKNITLFYDGVTKKLKRLLLLIKNLKNILAEIEVGNRQELHFPFYGI